MMTVTCPFCRKSFTFSTSSAPHRVQENMSSGSKTKIVYQPACSHCGKTTTVVTDKR
jgi:endogenous inhibitor of DNA gyrase (YacG/DUF329 family)